jgi:hypothetical protein
MIEINYRRKKDTLRKCQNKKQDRVLRAENYLVSRRWRRQNPITKL